MPHLKEEARNRRERYLNKDLSFRSIAESMGKDPSTISREVRKHRIPSRKTSESCVLNNCQHRFECKIEGLCKKFQTSCNSKCCTCRQVSCNDLCRMFSAEECPRLVNAPYVCNGCRRERQCSLTKYYYKRNTFVMFVRLNATFVRLNATLCKTKRNTPSKIPLKILKCCVYFYN